MVKKKNEGNCTIRYDKPFTKYLKKDNIVKYTFLGLLLAVVILACFSLYGINHYLGTINIIDWLIFGVVIANAIILMVALGILLGRNFRLINALKDEEVYDEKSIRNINSNERFMKVYRIIVLVLAITFSVGAVVYFVLKFSTFFNGTDISMMPILIIFLAISSWISFSNLSYDRYVENNLYVDYGE